MWELLGINSRGHDNLKHLLLNEDWPKKKLSAQTGNKVKEEKDVGL